MITHRPSPSGKIIAGLIVISVGTIFLLRQLGYYFPNWLFSWPMILIVVGLINGAKRGFRNFGWLLLVGLGMAFLLDQMYPIYHVTRYAWPMLIIAAGLFMIFGRHRSWPNTAARWQELHNQQNCWPPPMGNPSDLQAKDNKAAIKEPLIFSTPVIEVNTPETKATSLDMNTSSGGQKGKNFDKHTNTNHNGSEFVDVNAVLGGIKRTIFSKNVTGADINAFMGGAELNFTQADIQGRVVMDVNLVMGGCKLIVPSNWEVLSEITTILGGVDDKRSLAPLSNTHQPKILVLKGVAFMGGIEIQSYI